MLRVKSRKIYTEKKMGENFEVVILINEKGDTQNRIRKKPNELHQVAGITNPKAKSDLLLKFTFLSYLGLF